jgi:hypothetical protein
MRLLSILFICFLSSTILYAQKHNKNERYEIKESFNEKNIPPAPDYSINKYWAALPHMKDAADTVPVGLKDMQSTAPADVFFIHPTTFIYEPDGAYHWNADVDDEKLNQRTDHTTIRYQATVFNGSCRVYAPRYRQGHISVYYTLDRNAAKKALALAYADVESAFLYYVQHYNNGRPFIIASHSQGTQHAQQLVKRVIEKDSVLLSHFICGYLVGMPVPADSFNVIKPCTQPDDLQCFCSWSTFQHGYYPAWYSISQKNAAVINPLSWRVDSICIAASNNKGAVLRDFRKIKPYVCDATVYRGMLWIHTPKIPLARTMNGGNYHIGDYNLFYMNIRVNVEERVRKFLSGKSELNSE